MRPVNFGQMWYNGQVRFGQMQQNKDGQIRFGQIRPRPRLGVCCYVVVMLLFCLVVLLLFFCCSSVVLLLFLLLLLLLLLLLHENPQRRVYVNSFRAPALQTPPRIQRKDTQEREKKARNFWPPPLRAPTLRAPKLRAPPGRHPSGLPPHNEHPTTNTPPTKKMAKCGLAKFGQQKLAKFGQTRLAKCGQLTLAKCGIDHFRFGQMQQNKDGQIRFSQIRSRQAGHTGEGGREPEALQPPTVLPRQAVVQRWSPNNLPNWTRTPLGSPLVHTGGPIHLMTTGGQRLPTTLQESRHPRFVASKFRRELQCQLRWYGSHVPAQCESNNHAD